MREREADGETAKDDDQAEGERRRTGVVRSCMECVLFGGRESGAATKRAAQKRDRKSERRAVGGRPGGNSLQVGKKVKKKMRCHPIVLLAGLLTVVRAQGQSLPGIPLRLTYLYSYSLFPTMTPVMSYVLCVNPALRTFRRTVLLRRADTPPHTVRVRTVVRASSARREPLVVSLFLVDAFFSRVHRFVFVLAKTHVEHAGDAFASCFDTDVETQWTVNAIVGDSKSGDDSAEEIEQTRGVARASRNLAFVVLSTGVN